jgi:hypothetical protein
MEDANWMPYLKQFLNTDKVLADSLRRSHSLASEATTRDLTARGSIDLQTQEIVEETRLQACLDGYGRFLTGKKQGGDQDDQDAPYDVDIIWCPQSISPLLLDPCLMSLVAVILGVCRHAHMVHPEAYWSDCAQMGLALNHRPWPHLYPPSS